MVKTLKGFNKVMGKTFTKVINGEQLTPKEQKQVDNYIKDLGGYQPKQEQPKTEEQPKQELTLKEWGTLSEEQQTTLKESLLKSRYGLGGEHFSTFPTLLDNKINKWVEEKYLISKLPGRIQEQTFKQWGDNGTLKILPVEKDNKTYYLTILLPNKEYKINLWELTKENKDKNTLQYTTHNLLGDITLEGNNFHILNGYTNKNKAYNQGKALVKLLQLGTPFNTLEQQKELQQNFLQLNISDKGDWELREIGGHSKQATGKTFKGIGDYLGREQHKDITTNYMELLQTI